MSVEIRRVGDRQHVLTDVSGAASVNESKQSGTPGECAKLQTDPKEWHLGFGTLFPASPQAHCLTPSPGSGRWYNIGLGLCVCNSFMHMHGA